MILELIEYAWLAISTLVFFYSAYKVAHYTTLVSDDVKKRKLDEAKEQWKTDAYQNKAYRWKVVRWYTAWLFAPFIIALLWLPAIPVLAGHNVAENEKAEKAALEESNRLLQEYYERAEIEAAKVQGREPILDLSKAISSGKVLNNV